MFVQYIRAAVHWGKVVDKTIKFVIIETQCIEQPLCTHDILPHSSWYAPGVLNFCKPYYGSADFLILLYCSSYEVFQTMLFKIEN